MAFGTPSIRVHCSTVVTSPRRFEAHVDSNCQSPSRSGKAPLCFYCLKEAELGGGRQLGPVAGRIVAEVILGLLQADQSSYWNARTPFTPIGGPGFRMGDLIKLAGAPVVDIVETPEPLEFGAARGVIKLGR